MRIPVEHNHPVGLNHPEYWLEIREDIGPILRQTNRRRSGATNLFAEGRLIVTEIPGN